MELSAITIAIIVIVLFVFRSTIKTITKRLPKTTDKVVMHLDKVITVNLLEEEVELDKRIIAINNEVPEEEIPDLDELWEKRHGKTSSNNAATPKNNNRRNS